MLTSFIQLYGNLYYIPLYFISVRDFSPIRTGIALFPVLFSLLPSAIVVGNLISRFNAFRGAIWAGWVITTLVSGLMLLWNEHTPTAVWATILVIGGIGHGLLLNGQNIAAQAICKPRDEGAAATMYALLRGFGMAVGVAIGGSIFQNVMKIKLRQLGLPEEIANQAESYIPVLHQLPDGLPLKESLMGAYVYGLHGVYGSFCGIAGLAGLVSILLQHYDLNRKLEGEHTLETTAWPIPNVSKSERHDHASSR